MAKYNFLIVGGGLFGSTCARLLTDKGYKCIIVDQEDHLGGLCYTERKNDIDIHVSGPHVFHTNNDEVWDFVNKYAQFNNYRHMVITQNGGKVYHMPFTMNSFNEVLGTQFPYEAREHIIKELDNYMVKQPSNLEEQCVSFMGYAVYNKLVKGYTEKLWGMKASEVNMDVMKHMNMRFTWDTSYYSDKYQGIPMEGYDAMINNIIGDDIDGMLGKTFDPSNPKWLNLADAIIYTGPVDAFCNYIYGPLHWRSLVITTTDESSKGNNIIGNSVMNVADPNDPLLQVIEHKWFTPERINNDMYPKYTQSTFVSYVRAVDWDTSKYPMYPVNTEESEALYIKYIQFIEQNFNNVICGGRAGLYRPMSMGETIEAAFRLCDAF